MGFEYAVSRGQLLADLHKFRETCPTLGHVNTRCAHGLAIQEALTSPGQAGGCVGHFVNAMHIMLRQSADCACVRLTLSSYLQWFASRLNQRLTSEDPDLRLKDNFVDRARIVKRGRVDDEFKRLVAMDNIRRGRASSACEAVRSLGADVGGSSGRAWEEGVLLQQNAADIGKFSRPQHVRVAEDGSRIGTPGEESIQYFCWEGSTNLATCWAPQVYHQG